MIIFSGPSLSAPISAANHAAAGSGLSPRHPGAAAPCPVPTPRAAMASPCRYSPERHLPAQERGRRPGTARPELCRQQPGAGAIKARPGRCRRRSPPAPGRAAPRAVPRAHLAAGWLRAGVFGFGGHRQPGRGPRGAGRLLSASPRPPAAFTRSCKIKRETRAAAVSRTARVQTRLETRRSVVCYPRVFVGLSQWEKP